MAIESQQEKRALLIGINDYPNFSKLNGCVNDVTAMHQMLTKRFGFSQDNMVLMTNAEATQAAIRAAMAKLVSDTGSDDIVVVHFAGHGSQTLGCAPRRRHAVGHRGSGDRGRRRPTPPMDRGKPAG